MVYNKENVIKEVYFPCIISANFSQRKITHNKDNNIKEINEPHPTLTAKLLEELWVEVVAASVVAAWVVEKASLEDEASVVAAAAVSLEDADPAWDIVAATLLDASAVDDATSVLDPVRDFIAAAASEISDDKASELGKASVATVTDQAGVPAWSLDET